MAEEHKSVFERIRRAIIGGLAILGFVVVIALIMKSQTKPNLPISVITRNAIFGPGRVIRFSNYSSGATLDVVATFTNPTTQEQKTYNVTISPGRFSEIGHAQGWIVHTGDQVSLFSAGYRTMTYTLQ